MVPSSILPRWMKIAISLLLIIIFECNSQAPDTESECNAAHINGMSNYNEQDTGQTTHKHNEFILHA